MLNKKIKSFLNQNKKSLHKEIKIGRKERKSQIKEIKGQKYGQNVNFKRKSYIVMG